MFPTKKNTLVWVAIFGGWLVFTFCPTKRLFAVMLMGSCASSGLFVSLYPPCSVKRLRSHASQRQFYTLFGVRGGKSAQQAFNKCSRSLSKLSHGGTLQHMKHLQLSIPVLMTLHNTSCVKLMLVKRQMEDKGVCVLQESTHLCPSHSEDSLHDSWEMTSASPS